MTTLGNWKTWMDLISETKIQSIIMTFNVQL